MKNIKVENILLTGYLNSLSTKQLIIVADVVENNSKIRWESYEKLVDSSANLREARFETSNGSYHDLSRNELIKLIIASLDFGKFGKVTKINSFIQTIDAILTNHIKPWKKN